MVNIIAKHTLKREKDTDTTGCCCFNSVLPTITPSEGRNGGEGAHVEIVNTSQVFLVFKRKKSIFFLSF